MSFADDLRSHSPGKDSEKRIREEAERTADNIIVQLKGKCNSAAEHGENSFSGYIRSYFYDDEYYLDFYADLPTVSQWEERAAKRTAEKYNGGLYAKYPQTHEYSLFSNYVLTDCVDYINAIRDSLVKKISMLGFSNYHIDVISLDDITIVEHAQRVIIRGYIRYTISTRAGNKTYYTLKIGVRW